MPWAPERPWPDTGVTYTLAAKPVNELVEAADDERLNRTIAPQRPRRRANTCEVRSQQPGFAAGVHAGRSRPHRVRDFVH
jgi:hypothetical protein